MPQTYRDTDDPKDALSNALAFNSRDWGTNKTDAWLWGIIVGWDDDPMVPDAPGEDGINAMQELAAKHGWDDYDVERLRSLHRAFVALS